MASQRREPQPTLQQLKDCLDVTADSLQSTIDSSLSNQEDLQGAIHKIAILRDAKRAFAGALSNALKGIRDAGGTEEATQIRAKACVLLGEYTTTLELLHASKIDLGGSEASDVSRFTDVFTTTSSHLSGRQHEALLKLLATETSLAYQQRQDELALQRRNLQQRTDAEKDRLDAEGKQIARQEQLSLAQVEYEVYTDSDVAGHALLAELPSDTSSVRAREYVARLSIAPGDQPVHPSVRPSDGPDPPPNYHQTYPWQPTTSHSALCTYPLSPAIDTQTGPHHHADLPVPPHASPKTALDSLAHIGSPKSRPFHAPGQSTEPTPYPPGLRPVPAESTNIATSRFLLRKELFQRSATPFTGVPHRYLTWMTTLSKQIEGLPLSSLDLISILEANTGGEALEVVQTYQIAGGANPEVALAEILKELADRFGSGVRVSTSIQRQLAAFPAITGGSFGTQVRALKDLCRVVHAHMATFQDLQVLNFASGLKPVWKKLPSFLQNRWRKLGSDYETRHQVQHPPFTEFIKFLESSSKELCNDNYDDRYSAPSNPKPPPARTLLTNTTPEEPGRSSCALHGTKGHSITECYAFARLLPDERAAMVNTRHLCPTCLSQHATKDTVCHSKAACTKCTSTSHHTLLHSANGLPDTSAARQQVDQELVRLAEAPADLLPTGNGGSVTRILP